MKTKIKRQFSSNVPLELRPMFLHTINEGNLNRIYLLSQIGFGFLFLLLALDFSRWHRDHMTVWNFRIFCSHCFMAGFGVVALLSRSMLRKLAAGVKVPGLTAWVLVFPIIVGLILFPIAYTTRTPNGWEIFFAIFIQIANLSVTIGHRERALLNILSIVSMAVPLILIKGGNLEIMYIRFMEIAGLTFPAFLVGTAQYNSKAAEFMANHHLADEKRRSEDLLLNILPAAVAVELKANGFYRPRHYSDATILFIDIENFTQFASTLSPEHLVEVLNEHFSAFDAIVGEFGLEKIKTLGDSYICVGGLPEPQIDHAPQVVRAAQKMLFSTQIMGESPFQMRFGINTGPVVAGVVGTRKFAFDIWGDAVNIAARMEQLGRAGQITLSESTFLKVKNEITCRSRGFAEAKGKGQIAIFEVVEG